MSVGQKFRCKCGKTEGWVEDGKIHPNACPSCGRRYKGVYNKKKMQIEAIEIAANPAQREGS